MRDVINIRPIFLQNKCKNVIYSTAFFAKFLMKYRRLRLPLCFFMKCKVAMCTDHQYLIFVLGLVFSQCATQALLSIWKTKIYTNFW